MLLSKIEGNRVYFGNLVTFLGERGGVNLPPTDPLDPLEGVSRGKLARKFSKGGELTPQDPLTDIYGHLPCLPINLEHD